MRKQLKTDCSILFFCSSFSLVKIGQLADLRRVPVRLEGQLNPAKAINLGSFLQQGDPMRSAYGHISNSLSHRAEIYHKVNIQASC